MAIAEKQVISEESLAELAKIAGNGYRLVSKVDGIDEVATVRSDYANPHVSATVEDLPRTFKVHFSDGTSVNYPVAKRLTGDLPTCATDKRNFISHDGQGKEYTQYLQLYLPDGAIDPYLKTIFPFKVFVSYVQMSSSTTDTATGNVSARWAGPTVNLDNRNYNIPQMTRLNFINESNYSNKDITSIASFEAPSVTQLSFPSTLVSIGDVKVPLTTAETLFYNKTSLQAVGTITTELVTNFRWMFKNCSALTNVGVLDLSSATDVTDMFTGCTALTDGSVHLKNVPKSLDLSVIGCDASKYVIDSYKEDTKNSEAQA